MKWPILITLTFSNIEKSKGRLVNTFTFSTIDCEKVHSTLTAKKVTNDEQIVLEEGGRAAKNFDQHLRRFQRDSLSSAA